MQFDLIATHKYCSNNHKSILKSKLCGCFYCLRIFPSEEVANYIDQKKTAVCPYCGIDAVLCDADIEFDKSKLQEMNFAWF